MGLWGFPEGKVSKLGWEGKGDGSLGEGKEGILGLSPTSPSGWPLSIGTSLITFEDHQTWRVVGEWELVIPSHCVWSPESSH